MTARLAFAIALAFSCSAAMSDNAISQDHINNFNNSSVQPVLPDSSRDATLKIGQDGVLPVIELNAPAQPPEAIDLTAEPEELFQRVRRGFAMPNLNNSLVLHHQQYYQNHPDYLRRMVERSSRYLHHIVEELDKRGMPMELALLPMVESAYNPTAYSRSRASGLWQFVPSTGKQYKLEQNSWVDERRDIVASTAAALDYLQYIYELHGDWHLALASYNWGEGAVGRAINKNKAQGLPTDYQSLSMPEETRNYVPKLQALKNIIARPELFGIKLDPIPNQPYFDTIGRTGPMDIALAAKLAEMFPGDLNHFQFTSGGAESNETALKMARYYWWLKGKGEKVKILSRKMGYHGIAMGALAATGIPAYHEGFGPSVPGYVHLSAPYAYRNGEGLSDAEFVAKLVAELEETIAREGADTIAAMIGEPVQGAGGVVVPPDGYWQAIAPVLKKHDILLIFDEVICGFGRTGTLFGMEQYGVTPDIVSFAKGITSGYVPLGGVGISDEVFDVLSEPDRMFMHGFTYSGHPVACAVALANIQIIEEERLPENAGRAGAYLLDRLSQLGDRPYVGNVRGKGLMLMVELVADKATKAKFDPAWNLSGKMTKATRDRGLIVRCSNDGVAIAPILTIQKPELDLVADGIAEALDEVMATR